MNSLGEPLMEEDSLMKEGMHRFPADAFTPRQMVTQSHRRAGFRFTALVSKML